MARNPDVEILLFVFIFLLFSLWTLIFPKQMSYKFNKDIDGVYNNEKLRNIKDKVFIMRNHNEYFLKRTMHSFAPSEFEVELSDRYNKKISDDAHFIMRIDFLIYWCETTTLKQHLSFTLIRNEGDFEKFRKKIGKKHLLLIGEKLENIYVNRSKFFTKEYHFGLIKTSKDFSNEKYLRDDLPFLKNGEYYLGDRTSLLNTNIDFGIVIILFYSTYFILNLIIFKEWNYDSEENEKTKVKFSLYTAF